MPSKKTTDFSITNLLSIAGGAIIAGSIGTWLFKYFSGTVPNELIAVIAGMAGGIVNLIQNRIAKRNNNKEETND